MNAKQSSLPVPIACFLVLCAYYTIIVSIMQLFLYIFITFFHFF